MADSFIKRIGGLLPKNIIRKFDDQLNYGGINTDAKAFIGVLLVFSLVLSALVALAITIYFRINFALVFLACFIGLVLVNYFLLYMSAESKGRQVDKILPDALQLLASNMKTGLTIEKALVASARDEFGPLSIEFKTASKKILASRRMENALMEIPQHIRSKDLQRAIWLIVEGIKSGGQTADLLIQLSNDLRQERELKDEVKANISIYSVMIWFVSLLGGPGLLGISSVIVKIITTNVGSIPAVNPTAIYGAAKSSSAAGLVLTGEIIKPVPPEFVVFISLALLTMNAVFSSLVLAVIQTGNERNGVKYMPIMLVVGLTVYTITRTVMGEAFSSIS